MSLALLGALVLASQSTAPPLFHTTLTQPEAGVGIDTVAMRTRVVELDMALLAAAEGAELTLNLFPGVEHLATFEAPISAYAGGVIWDGTVAGEPASSVTLSVVGEAVTGTVRIDTRLFRIMYAGNGVHNISESNEQGFPGCGIGLEQMQEPTGSANEVGSAGSRAPDIDALVVYSTQSKNSAGGTNGMNSLINLAVTETNQAYSTSTVNQRIRLVHTAEMIGYTEPSSFSSILTHLQSKNDGRMDEVHVLRDQYGADVVAMIVNNNQYCGIANLMSNVSPSFENRAFSVTSRTCATGYYSFGHEIGHNCGSMHDPGNGGGAAYSYGYGYRTPNQAYRTVMAYAPGTRVKRFSSPNATWAGNTMGNASQDNARSMNNTASTVAGFRAAQVTPVLQVANLTAGQVTSLTTTNCTANGAVFVAFSLTGGGPTPTSFGTVSLSQPIELLPAVFANGSGVAVINAGVPAAAGGRTVWIQSLDLSSGAFSNGLQAVIN